MIKNKIGLLVLIMVLSFSFNAFGAVKQAALTADQKNALNHMELLGAMDKLSNADQDSSNNIRRDELAKLLVITTGNQDLADSLKYQSIFSDVKTSNKMIGYINASVNKGLLTGMADGKFHPEQYATYAQLCTAVVKALGYTDNDVPGVWPKNYVEKARALKLLDGIVFSNSNNVPRWAAAQIMDRALNTNVKGTNPQSPAATLLNSTGIYSDCIILGNSQTSNRLDDNQVLTDQGIFYLTNSSMNLQVGNKYRVKLDDGTIAKVYYSLKTIKNVVISNVNNTKITYQDNNATATMTLPDKVVYYYNGVKQSYDSIVNTVQSASSIIFAYNDNNIGYEYGIVLTNDAGNTGAYGEYLILGNSTTMSKLGSNQVITDKGILYLKDDSIKLQIGNKYRLMVDNDTIQSVQNSLDDVSSIVVNSVNGSTISYKDNGKMANMTLPDKVSYYYQGTKQTYDNLKNVLQGDSTIIFATNSDQVGYEYAVIVDPVYSSPVIALSVRDGDKRIGSINLQDGEPIVKDGDFINLSKIQDGEVVYEVSDLNKNNKYILVIDNNVVGTLTGISPNRLYPTSIQIDSKNYDISKDMNIDKLSGNNSTFKIDDRVQIYLGYDNKVVDISYPGTQDSSNYAMVINTSQNMNTDSTGRTIYNVKMLKSDGTLVYYNVMSDPSSFKGKLVTYDSTDGITCVLAAVPYVNTGDLVLDKDDMMLGDSYVDSNVKIFNVISNLGTSDAVVNILNWNDMHSGTIPQGKILYLKTVGAFDDISLMVGSDIYDQYYSTGIVRQIDNVSDGKNIVYQYTINVGGKDYKYTSSYIMGVGVLSAVKVSILNGQVSYPTAVSNPNVTGTNIQALDFSRIKMNNVIYRLSDNATIFYVDKMGTITNKKTNEIDITKTYSKISIYLDKPVNYGGEVTNILISE